MSAPTQQQRLPAIAVIASACGLLAVAGPFIGYKTQWLWPGLLGFSGMVLGIVLGHRALRIIRRDPAHLRGVWLAQIGLAGSYSLLAFLAVGVITFERHIDKSGGERGAMVRIMNNGRMLFLACELYADDHGGAFPETLEHLVTGGYIGEDQRPLLGPPPYIEWDGQAFWDYRPAVSSRPEDDDAMILISNWRTSSKWFQKREHIVVFGSGSIRPVPEDAIEE